MDQAHIHLLITHLPIFGSLLGSLVLIHALWTKNDQTKMAAFYVFILSAIGAGIAYATGEGAEEAVEHMQGISENAIEAHEEFAMFALVATIILGAVSIVGLYLARVKSPMTRTVALVALFIGLISFGLTARTGYLGGKIHHTEVNGGNTNANGAAESEEGEEEDDD